MNTFFLAVVLIVLPGGQSDMFIDGTHMYESQAECVADSNARAIAVEKETPGVRVTTHCVRLSTVGQENGIES